MFYIPVSAMLEPVGCPACHWVEEMEAKDERTTLTPGALGTSTDIVTGIGKGHRLVALAKRHHPVGAPEVFEMRHALIEWLTVNADFSPLVLPLVEFGPLHKASAMHPLEHRLYPKVQAVIGDGFERTDRLYIPLGSDAMPYVEHPLLLTNVFELSDYHEWPLRVADEYVSKAQEYVGYFYGRRVISGQMQQIRTDERGQYDASVVLTDEAWSEPFVIEDDCIFCQRMTDETVEERVAGFQWEIDKESSSTVSSVSNTEFRHSDFPATAEGRAEYHARIEQLAGTPGVGEFWRPFPLIRLPHEVKRKLCIEWNHIVRDWLAGDQRYCYVDGNYYVIWTERIGGLDTEPTRSDTYGGGSANPWAGWIPGYTQMGSD